MQEELHQALSALTGKSLLVALSDDGRPVRLASDDELASLSTGAHPRNIAFVATVDALTDPTRGLRTCFASAAAAGLILRFDFEEPSSLDGQVPEVVIAGTLYDTIRTPTGKLGLWRVLQMQRSEHDSELRSNTPLKLSPFPTRGGPR